MQHFGGTFSIPKAPIGLFIKYLYQANNALHLPYPTKNKALIIFRVRTNFHKNWPKHCWHLSAYRIASRVMYEMDLSILFRLKLHMNRIVVIDLSQGTEVDPNLIEDECPEYVAVPRKMLAGILHASINVKRNRCSDCKVTKTFCKIGKTVYIGTPTIDVFKFRDFFLP